MVGVRVRIKFELAVRVVPRHLSELELAWGIAAMKHMGEG
jgi:hypothetical protein